MCLRISFLSGQNLARDSRFLDPLLCSFKKLRVTIRRITLAVSLFSLPNYFRAAESKRKGTGTGKGKKGKTKPGFQGKNKKPAGKSGRKSGKKKTKI